MSTSDSQSPEDTTDKVVTTKVYHPKRPHKKTRTGCKNCKVRKVKCDESRPSCRSCKIRGIPCMYEVAKVAPASRPSRPNMNYVHSQRSHTPMSPRHEDSFLLGDDNINNSLIVVSEPQFVPAAVDAVDLKLLWFFTTVTHTSFSMPSPTKSINEGLMSGEVVRHAFENKFLMNSVFALSSLHMQNLNQPVDPTRSLTYRARSYEGYRKAIEAADPSTYPALMATSLMLAALSSQTFRDPNTPDLYIIDWMIVWRGMSTLLTVITFPVAIKTDIAHLFYRPPMDLSAAAAHIPPSLLMMVAGIEQDDPDYAERDEYLTALKYLATLYQNLQDGLPPVMRLRIITWFTYITPRFADLVREKRPRALVILAHYSAFLRLTRRVWWMAGIGIRSLKGLLEYLDDPKWTPFLTMPLAAVIPESELDVARAILDNPLWDMGGSLPQFTQLSLLEPNDMFYTDDVGNLVQLDSEGNMVAGDPYTLEPVDVVWHVPQ